MKTSLNPEQKIIFVQSMCATLAGVCDGAHARDHVGFNGSDAEFGHVLGTTAPEYWSAKMYNIALRMLPKYHRQLGEDAAKVVRDLERMPEERGSVVIRWRKQIEQQMDMASDLPESNEDLPVQWGKPKNVNTKRGRRSLRKAMSTDDMRRLWRRHKDELKRRGISVTPVELSEWIFCWWGEPVEDEVTRFEKKANADLPPLPILSPDVIEKLLPYQTSGTQRLLRGLDHWGAVYDGSDTGVGKTYKALAVVKERGGTPVVVCPLAIVPGWHRAAKHFGMKVVAINYESLKTGKSELGTVSRDGGFKFTWTLDHISNPVIIFDEVHRCKNPKAQNTEMLLSAERSGLPVIMLSATGAQDPLDMFAIGSVLHLFPKTKKGFWTWAREHGVANNGWGMAFMGDNSHLQDIHQEIYGKGRGDRTRIAEIPEFPRCRFEANLADYGKATKEINEMAQELEAALSNLKERSRHDAQPELVLTRILRARQRLELLKAPTWAALAGDEVAEGRSVVIFCAFNETIELLADALQTDCIIWGNQNAKQREANRMRFMTNEEHVILVNVNAGGQALELDDQTGDRPRTALLPVDFNARMVQQAVGRIWRAKTRTPSLQKFYYAAGTIESSMADTCQEKLNRISLINDGNIDDVIQIVAKDY